MMSGIRTKIATALAIPALAATGLLAAAPAAHAASTPTYDCDNLVVVLHTVTGEVCTASVGAPDIGPISGSFVIQNLTGAVFDCKGPGEVELPTLVYGEQCTEQ